MKENPDFSSGTESRESRELEPTIRLEFFRHDKKASSKTEMGESIPDERINLSGAGRTHAQETGKMKNPSPETALVYGSPRDRTIETAYRQMLANESGIKPENTLDDIREIVKENLPVNAQKEIKLESLNFHPSASKEFQQAADDRYEKTLDYLVFLQKDSDALAQKVGDPKADTYSRFAAGIAEIIAKYITAYAAWKRIVEKDREKYEESNFEMQRFVGTHQSIGESFLMKAIEKTEGENGVNEFLEMLPDKNGFAAGDGFTAEIKEEDGKQMVALKYKDRIWNVEPSVINQIVTERI